NLRGSATTPGAAPASPGQRHAAFLHLCCCSEERGGNFPGPPGIAPVSAAQASSARRSLPDLPQSTDRGNSSTAPDRPTTDAPSRGPEPGCQARALPGLTADT